jgi:murein DD-endopeptidase MepM/ murein hydrolase activator NlpD
MFTQSIRIASFLTLAALFSSPVLAQGGASQTTSRGSGMSTGDRLAPAGWLWPMPGTDGDDWVINNYVDLNPGSGILDYMGGSKSYNGHRGIDIDVPTFREMDADFPIRAVDDGQVIDLFDSNFDRNMSCTGQWNFVTVLHSSGLRSIYGHLKKDSVVVSIGQSVQRGQTLGVVGSSGCSTHPHLHLEVRNSKNAVIDPFSDGLFADPPVYDTPLSFMDAVLKEGSITSTSQIQDPAPNITQLDFGKQLGVGLSMAGGQAGDQIDIVLKRPNGSVFSQTPITFSGIFRHSFWISNFLPSQELGSWTVEIKTNGSLAASYPILIGPPVSESRIARFKIPHADYQEEFLYYANNGYRPVFFDGYDVNGQAYVNAIFEQSSGTSWMAKHGQTGASFDSDMSFLVNIGWRPTLVESYKVGNSIRYAFLAESSSGPDWAVYRAASASTHGTNFNTYANLGYRAAMISPLIVGGSYSITALYDKANVGGWVALAGLTTSQYQDLFNDEIQAGRKLAYLNVFDNGSGTPLFSAIFNTLSIGSWASRHDLTESGIDSEHSWLTSIGLKIRVVTGYAFGGSHRFGGHWSSN